MISEPFLKPILIRRLFKLIRTRRFYNFKLKTDSLFATMESAPNQNLQQPAAAEELFGDQPMS